MAEFPKSSTTNASILRKIKKRPIKKKRKTKINQSHDQLKITLVEIVKKNEPQVSRLDKSEILEMTATYLHQLPKQDNTSTAELDGTRAKEYKSGYEECIRKVIHYLNSANGITHEMKSRMESHLSATVKYSRGNLVIRSPLDVPVKSSYFTPLHVNIPSSTQYPSTTAMTPDSNEDLLVPLPSYPVIKTEDLNSLYYYPTMQNDSSVCATTTEDPILNESSGNSFLNEQFSQGQDFSSRKLSLSNSAGNTSVKCDTVWRPW